MIRILFVCLGNICRSPLAEAIFQHKLEKSDLADKIKIDSAGTGNYHIGEGPDYRTLEVAKNYNIKINHIARQLTKNDFDEFEYVIAMDKSNLRHIKTLHKTESVPRIFLMRDFDETDETDVPDPYFGGEDGFEEVFSILDSATENFLAFLRKEHHL